MKPIENKGLPSEEALEQAIANIELEGMKVSPKMVELIKRMKAGEITTDEALEELGVLPSE